MAKESITFILDDSKLNCNKLNIYKISFKDGRPFATNEHGMRIKPNRTIKLDKKRFENVNKVRMDKVEIDNFSLHSAIWKTIANNLDNNWTLIIDENVVLKRTLSHITKALTDLPVDTDIFFPYNKISDYTNVKGIQLSATRLGFF